MRTRTTSAARKVSLGPAAENLIVGAMKLRVLAALAVFFIRLLRLTWRVRVAGPAPPADRRAIFCFWHGRQAGLLAYPLRRETVVMTSLSRDGALQSRIMRALGFAVVRGSSSRAGAAGLKGLVDAVRAGADAALAVDGPRGPAFRAKNGAAHAALKTEAVLLPMAVRASSHWRFARSWDDYRLPKPFAEILVERGRAIEPQGSVAEITGALEQAMKDLEEKT